ncbi:DNase I-like protein [Cylindrobasidium torrendii FP15055 ss-10]|uniref:DNase I-like protein n=1 Tax=Cylindrobasidium torrendii FP15055 ss-10 TaxID=1314674 RepID=A0A0D7AX56_9AGAR|nr:DNase I-like protein [Cylindrobasidium torrendii FP15055 ss-10]
MQEPGRPALPIRPTVPVPSNVSPTEYVTSPVSDRRVLGASKALPPPMRKIGLNDKLPEIRKPVGHDDSDSDSESEDEEMVKGVETLPDSTNTSRRMPHMHNIHEGYRTNVPVKMDLYHGHCRMSGTHVVVAENHKIRIYDISFQDAPIYVLDPKSAGMKAGEMKCIEFRAGGRYFWVGTSNGCVFEGDTHTGEFTGAKPSAHLQTVTHIFRHADSMITLDESGKALVWTPHAQGEPIRLSNHIPRVVRISEKIDYAKCVNGMLWTAHRKDRMNVGTPQSVPVIRVYDILAPGCVARNVFTTSHAGPITCATILPSDPSHAYAGHEEGFISIWDIDTPDRYPVCVEVMKVSTTDVLCMEGVYNRLWTGARSGLVTVYDISQRPWQVTNSWAPHNGMPVVKLQVDPFGVARTRRLCVLTHARDEVLHFWDGMLSVDWMEDQLLKHEQSFSTFRDLNVLIMTWNCDAAKPEHLSGDPANLELLQDVLTSVDSPDVLVFGFQEMIDLESRKLAAKNIVTSLNKKHEDIGPGPEKLGGPYKKWYDRLALTIRLTMPPDCPYVCVTADSLIGLFQCVFVKVSERVSLKSLEVNSVKRGIGGRYGNKGAILSRLVIDDTSLCFINCHLAAGQSHVRSRNADVTSILEAATVFPPDQSSKPVAYVGGGDGAAVADHEIIYLNGDLNYRIDQRRDAIINAVKLNDLDSMLNHDQLLKEIKYNRGCRLRTFTEGHIRFGPTYKFDRRTDTYDTSEKRRAPAWCDRVMWRSAVPARVEQLHYQRYEANVSDHRPVSAAFRMTVKSVRHEVRDKYRQEVEMRWAKEEQRLLDVLVSYYQSRELV